MALGSARGDRYKDCCKAVLETEEDDGKSLQRRDATQGQTHLANWISLVLSADS